MENVGRDVRFSLRSLRRAPAFTATVVATLALCIGANIAIVSVLYGIVLKPLPYRDAGQIVDVFNMRPKAGQMHRGMGVPQYVDYKANADLFEDFALWQTWQFNIGEEGGTSRQAGLMVTPEYFSVIGVQPLLGRFFTKDDCQPGRNTVTVLTQSYWENKFNADPAIIGKEVRLSGDAYTIIGVAPRRLEELSVTPRLLVPYVLSLEKLDLRSRLRGWSDMYARIKPGVAYGAAQAQLQSLEQRFLATAASPELRNFLVSGGHRIGLTQVREEQAAPIKGGLLMLQAGALLVLLLGCVNVASLMLARANTRQAEFAVRAALGAGRGALARQPLIESALLALAGGAVGLALAWGSLRVINAYLGKIILGLPPVQLDAGVLGLTLLITFVVALLIGLLPMVRVWRAHSLQGGLQSGTRGASRGGGIRAMSGVLVVAQVALALMLLIGAGLLMRSFAKVMAINPGFDARQVIHVSIAYDNTFKEDAAVQDLQDRLLQKMREIPGVERVAYSSRMPGDGENGQLNLTFVGRPVGDDSVAPTAVGNVVSPGYFETMGIRLLEGRTFTEADVRRGPGWRMALIVDRKFAEQYFPGESPVGQMLTGAPGAKPETLPIVVGVVEVARVSGLENPHRFPYIYRSQGTSIGGLSIELRTKRSFEEMMPLIRAQVRAVSPSLPISQAQTMQMRLDDKAANRRGILWLLGAFAGIALILSAVGIYGMLAYDVTQRTKEIGIRGAIGASREQIVTLILKQGLFKAGLGLVIGLGGALMLSRFMEKLLYDVKPTDPMVFIGVAAVLLAVALLASWLPARRAAKVDPMVALRYE